MSTDNHCTSPEVADLLERFYGGPVGCDPCTNERSIVRARRSYTSGALLLPWGTGKEDDRDAYENPPYSQMGAFTDRGIMQMQPRHRWRGRYSDTAARHGDLLELVRLVMATPSTAWWRRAIGEDPVIAFTKKKRISYYAPRPAIIFTRRLPFIGDDGRLQDGARFDSALFFYETSTYGPSGADGRMWAASRRADRVAAFFETFAPIARWSLDTERVHGAAHPTKTEDRDG